MDRITTYLGRFKNLTPPDQFVRECFCAVVYEHLSVHIKQVNVRVQNSVVFVAAAGPVKTELFTHKPVLLAALNKKLNTNTPIKDIR